MGTLKQFIEEKEFETRKAQLVFQHFPDATVEVLEEEQRQVFVAPDGDWATEVFPVIAKNAAGRPTMRLHRGRTVKGDDITVIVLAGPLWSSGVLAWPLFKELRAQHPDAYAVLLRLTKEHGQ